MVGDGRAAGHDLRVAADDVLRLDIRLHIQKVGVAVEVVEVLQKGEIERALDMLVAHHLRQRCGEVHGQLFVADGVFEDGLVGGL